MSTVIKVENLSKAYQLGEIGTGTISRDLERWFARIRGKEDPFLRIGETNDRSTKGESDVVWSLKDINFEVQQGEVLGIIGRNGAGKSTLLKILSRITSPTTGSLKVKGRIASLLEVGTGFHPELTGRENIYLNGAILGMRKREIDRKLDEIVDFSGVERYIDTPVKRYSSGMYVRLAFAVAAHLESEILIVDEVLAVGDAEFQQKCLGRMKDVSTNEGRTVLFVSHNMGAMYTLCKNGLVLGNGMVVHHSRIQEAINSYNHIVKSNVRSQYNGEGLIKRIFFKSKSGLIFFKSEITLVVFFKSPEPISNLILGFQIKDIDSVPLVAVNNRHYHSCKINQESIYEGEVQIRIPKLLLLPGEYKLDFFLGDSTTDIEVLEDAISICVQESTIGETANSINYDLNKIYMEQLTWVTKKK